MATWLVKQPASELNICFGRVEDGMRHESGAPLGKHPRITLTRTPATLTFDTEKVQCCSGQVSDMEGLCSLDW